MIDHVKQKMGEYTSSFNTIVDAHTAQGEELAWLKDKVADLDDRSRMNYIMIRIVPEIIPATHLLQYTQALFSTFTTNSLPDEKSQRNAHTEMTLMFSWHARPDIKSKVYY